MKGENWIQHKTSPKTMPEEAFGQSVKLHHVGHPYLTSPIRLALIGIDFGCPKELKLIAPRTTIEKNEIAILTFFIIKILS